MSRTRIVLARCRSAAPSVAIFLAAVVMRLGVHGEEYYVSTERLNVTYFSTEYGYMNATAARPGRWDYKHYVHSYLRLLKPLDNNVKADIWFYEFRSNEYRRGFVEMHFGLCDLIHKDKFFGTSLRANHLDCPVLPGEYRLSNMSMPDMPLLRTFPFRKGRVYLNLSENGVRVLEFYNDMEIKIKPKTRSNKSIL